MRRREKEGENIGPEPELRQSLRLVFRISGSGLESGEKVELLKGGEMDLIGTY